MSQAQTRTVQTKAGSVSLSAEFFTFALHARLRAQHPPTADKSVRKCITLAPLQTVFVAQLQAERFLFLVQRHGLLQPTPGLRITAWLP
jgi:hypothetical protein